MIFVATDFDVLTKENNDYAVAHGAASADYRGDLGDDWWYYTVDNSMPWEELPYKVTRGFLLFGTSGLEGRHVQSASLFLCLLFGGTEQDTGLATVHVVEGIQNTPLVLSDYGAHVGKTISGGYVTNVQIETYTWENPWLEIPLNSTGCQWINPSGMTKLCLRLSGDINNDTPTGWNRHTFLSTDGWYENPPSPENFPYLVINEGMAPRRTVGVIDKPTLELIRNVEMAAHGRFYTDEQGNAVYKSRYGRFA
jgi:hypothetical protein